MIDNFPSKIKFSKLGIYEVLGAKNSSEEYNSRKILQYLIRGWTLRTSKKKISFIASFECFFRRSSAPPFLLFIRKSRFIWNPTNECVSSFVCRSVLFSTPLVFRISYSALFVFYFPKFVCRHSCTTELRVSGRFTVDFVLKCQSIWISLLFWLACLNKDKSENS